MVITARRWFVALCPIFFGCNAILDIEPGDPRPANACVTIADCQPAVPYCQSAKGCVDYLCQYENVAENTPLPLMEQESGDCVEKVCDGAGNIKEIVANGDLDDDKNPCTIQECINGVYTVTIAKDAPCFSGPMGLVGKGVCKAGVWSCSDDGTPLECVGEVVPSVEVCDAELQDEDCDEKINESGDNCVCLSGEATSCYTGPVETLEVGACKIGQWFCAESGLDYGICIGEVLPSLEDCDMMGNDEDCDGQRNESGVNCYCGDGWFSEGEACDDGNVSNGDACSSKCVRTVSTMALGGFHTCALLVDGTVKCWGANYDGQLGLGDTFARGDGPDEMGMYSQAVLLGTSASASAIGAGSNHTCAVLVDGRLKCWGLNNYGQLGLGDKAPRGTTVASMGDNLPAVSLGDGLVVRALALGGYHSCALFDDGRIKCWGRNDAGQLGLEVGMQAMDHRGDEMNEMGNNLPFINLGAGVKAIAIAAGSAHTCALLESGFIKCWGAGGRGQLGLKGMDNWGDGPNEMGNKLPIIDVDNGGKAIAIAAGGDHTCALLQDGRVKCWGANGSGELGLGDKVDRLMPPVLSVALGTGANARALTTGAFHTCVLLEDERVKCWGWGMHGELGLDEPINRGDDMNEMGDMLSALTLAGPVKALFAGGAHNCVALADGSLRCWGNNSLGQLGLGNTDNQGDDPGEMEGLSEVRPY